MEQSNFTYNIGISLPSRRVIKYRKITNQGILFNVGLNYPRCNYEKRMKNCEKKIGIAIEIGRFDAQASHKVMLLRVSVKMTTFNKAIKVVKDFERILPTS